MLSEQFTQQTSTHLPTYSHLGAEGMASNPHEPTASSPEEPTNRINIQQFFWEFMNDPVEAQIEAKFQGQIEAQLGGMSNDVDRISSAVHRGVSRDGRFVGGDARDQEQDGDTGRRDNDLDRFGPSDRRNTLRHVSLVYCIEM